MFILIEQGYYSPYVISATRDLLQAIAPSPEGEDFSSDAIRKKRSYLKARYPAFYRVIVKRAENRLKSVRTTDIGL
jgi:hypothetical protein